jgi:hypothetical protein
MNYQAASAIGIDDQHRQHQVVRTVFVAALN